MTRPPPVSKVSELMVVVERTVAAAPELTPALTTRVLVLPVTTALATGTLISLVACNGLTPWLASRVRNWVVLAVPTLPTSTSATAQGMIRMVFPLVAVWPMNVLHPLGAVVVPRKRFVFVGPEACPSASPRMKRVAKLLEVRVPAPEVVMRRLAPLLSRVMTLWDVVTARY